MDYLMFKQVYQNISEVGQLISSYLLPIAMIFGPLTGYIFQYRLIHETKQIGSFSIDVCAILIFANILRIFFWFGSYYETPLLIQSIFMIIMQVKKFLLTIKVLALINLFIKYQKKYLQKERVFFLWQSDYCKILIEQPIKKFWRWATLQSYITSAVVFSIILSILCLSLWNFPNFWAVLGFFSCLVEATLGFPQMITNYKTKNTQGLSYVMILTWFLGDGFKTFYYIIRNSPIQFICCGVIQICVDTWIIFQIWLYKKQYIEL